MLRTSLVFAGLLLTSLQPPAQPSQTFDVLIRNGRVMDGSGNPWLRADVGISGDRIAAVGRLTGAAGRVMIEAADRLVAPGFIDVHSHALEGLVRAELREGLPLLAQGVTTIVGNPDGGGSVDLAAQRQRLVSGGIGPNAALLIGHGAVRAAVMGQANRAPTADELERMRELVKRGMQEGAFGLSSGLFYTPGSFAKTEEVIALAAVAGEFGGLYTSHIRDEGDYGIGVVASVDEVIRIAEEAREGRSLAQIAEARSVPAERAALDLLARGNASIVSFNMTDRDIEAIMRQPYTMTSSDGGLVLMSEGKPHPRNYGAFARKLAVYVRERKTISLESAIRSMTSLPAAVFSIRDRGIIRAGAFADVVVFDPARVRDRATYTDPHQLAEGMDYVLVNGVVVVDGGTFTKATPGRVLRK
jgi:N-acyl-D-aspartate/D-glutamate deacylase